MSEQVPDHRTRAGWVKRQKMRNRLIESAMHVFSDKGVDASVIDDVISVAGVSRGTFYNYFRTNTELVAAIGETLSNELISLIEKNVGEREDPLEVLAIGLRLFLHTARAYPKFGRFLWRAGFNIDAAGHLIYQYLPRHIVRGMQQDKLQVADVATALELIIGSMLVAVFGMSTRQAGADYPDQMVRHTLLALGVERQQTNRLLALPLPRIVLPKSSLLVRSGADE